jgi:hypothetical protein
MNPISNSKELSRYKVWTAGMTQNQCDFNPEWIKKHGWKVVPVEDTGHFATEQIATLVPALQKAGFDQCIAIATESVEPDGVPAYSLAISAEDFQSFNAECGLFRYLLTDAKRSWAISCGEWYNLFAGEPELLEKMLGKPVAAAREEFLSYANSLAKGQNDPLLRIAKHYAAL